MAVCVCECGMALSEGFCSQPMFVVCWRGGREHAAWWWSNLVLSVHVLAGAPSGHQSTGGRRQI